MATERRPPISSTQTALAQALESLQRAGVEVLPRAGRRRDVAAAAPAPASGRLATTPAPDPPAVRSDSLEIIRGATMHAAQALHEPSGRPIEFGIVRAGMLADMVIVDQNPLQNMKVLYGTGAVRLNDRTGRIERVGGIKYTIKDGIVYDAKQLLADVAAMVEKQKQERAKAGR